VSAEPGEIVLLGVYCDECGEDIAADFKVRESDSSAVRLGYVRAWAAKEHGWHIAPGVDLCGRCKPGAGG
jgi:hypothetical protein